eukprot:CAMPEP_0170535130 /NCGR_PEP_ID=MMETSP0209-20121228/97835_1 /TAXON_ID=665100 ORGANISM="Litonotus pictus, Strain P1" /NCGR_SAMPLE_ID=MMETSP0209 /ASSEMBLY_ACC=CAM_ASM_000301 /LENGTH=276 /DNA_ID=CAMNT_0010835655 /DNA_START=672 /DNA_END=1498 /DNA_ORIENTATION=-
MYPFRTNKVFAFLRAEEFYMRSPETNQDISIFEFFKDFLSSDFTENVLIIDHELSSYYSKQLKIYSFKSISLIQYFNEYVNKDSTEEKYFGSTNNKKDFFEFVNSPGFVGLKKRESLKSNSETSEYNSVKSIKDVSIYDEAEVLPENVNNFDFLNNKQTNNDAMKTLNNANKKPNEDYLGDDIIKRGSKLNCQDDKENEIYINAFNEANAIPAVRANPHNRLSESSNTFDPLNNNSVYQENQIPKARGGFFNSTDKGDMLMETEEKQSHKGGCCTG